jgi:hypothetical protein
MSGGLLIRANPLVDGLCREGMCAPRSRGAAAPALEIPTG